MPMAVICGQRINSIHTYKCVVMAFNNIYRTLFGILWRESMSAIYVNNNIDSIRVLVRKNVYSFKTRLGVTSNLLVQCIVSSLFSYHSSSCARWTKILNLLFVFNLLCLLYTSQYHI